MEIVAHFRNRNRLFFGVFFIFPANWYGYHYGFTVANHRNRFFLWFQRRPFKQCRHVYYEPGARLLCP